MMEILSSKLSDKEKEQIHPVADFLIKNDTIDTQMVATITGKSKTTARRYLQKLVNLGVLIKDGGSVSAVYKRI